MTERIVAPSPDSAAPSASLASRSLRSLAVVAAATVAMLVVDYAVSSVLIVALFAGGWPTLIVGLLVAALVLAAAIAALSRAFTGGAHVLGAVVVTIGLAIAGGYGFLNGILSPLITQQDWPRHLLVCALAAGALGLFLGPWPLRVAGELATVALVVVMSVLPTASEQAAVERAESQEQQAEEQRASFASDGIFPVVTDLDGWANARVRATGVDGITWMVSVDGAVADALVTRYVDDPALEPPPPWTWIQRNGDTEVPPPGELPSWCVKTETGWARADGSGIAFVQGDTLVSVNAGDEFDIRDAAGARPATPGELASLAASLRPMTDAEIDEWVMPTYAGVESPAVMTPGL